LAEDTNAAQELFDKTFGRTMKVQRFIWSFQSYMALGRPSASAAIAEQMNEFARDFIASPNFGTEEQQKAALVPLEKVLGRHLGHDPQRPRRRRDVLLRQASTHT
jgi:hypothetical protein